MTLGRWPFLEITGIDQRLIRWQSTRRQQIEEKELREQRRRLQNAAKRRLAAGQSRRPRPGRTGSASRSRAVMPASCPW
ncbi:relaxase domain-containing protein [Streptomyces sp. NPDC047725]|uniref:relaxase domain-containing protein n=1 Tax=Streptomyces sp. NPDC047725 TaxID=3365487 RepID=UPI00370FA6FF